MRTFLAILFAAAGSLSCSGPGGGPAAPTRVRVEAYLGVDPCLILEAPAARVAAIAMPQEAGRIVHYSVGGESILHQPVDKEGGLRKGGGYGLDVGPEPRTVPRPHPAIWNNRHTWGKLGDSTIALASEPCPVLGLKVDRQVTIDGRTGSLSIAQRMKNVAGGEQSYCLWDRTLCKAGGFTLIPLNPKSRFRARWALGKRNAARLWDYDGESPAHESCRVVDGVLVVKSIGPEQKVGADSDAGWIAYVRGRVLFVKYYPYDPAGKYTDGGLSVAHYFSPTVAELEPISPEVTLAPGADYLFPEKWTIALLDDPVTSFDEARALAASIPPSPFRRP